ncbi:DEAD/DEAH box helicase [Candidatus Protochlamydia phocaeensis]|uniref:DEAD/DEAH box helicase n=1 Tax=Candidatus Protochlamydia phocaeensis TaxID=1414722 RepID=UPI00083973E9|nr:DEAD/DEAH box helicase [Candidatus Protochlamydia phocaeensis]
MIQLPSYLKAYRQDAQKSLAQKLVKDIEFSGPTYQVLVQDLHSHKNYWVFLQLEGSGQIKDIFCSCEEGHERCLHQAVAYLSLFDNYSLPLHQRFARSLWDHLCRLYEDRLGDDSSILLNLGPGHYVFQTNLDKIVFSVKACTPTAIEFLSKLLCRRSQETEETSLKFSNLSAEDILLWREGRPNPQLRYDLSYWSDLAKWLMRLQEEQQPYQISFQYSKRKLPNWIQIDFEDVHIGFYLSEANLPLIIPSLKTVKGPLAIRNTYNQGIERIYYDRAEGVLHIESAPPEKTPKARKKKKEEEGEIQIEGWTFVPEEGFYTDEPHILLQTPDLAGEDLSIALTEHGRFIATLLDDCTIHRNPQMLSYKLAFDSYWNLHVQAYLFEEGDLSADHSQLIGDWAYLDGDGFYPIEGKRFDEAEMIVPIYQVADFVTQNRAWLNAQEGFHTHVRSIEYQLTYHISENNRLTFSRTLAKAKEQARMQDFGAWVYLEGYGFYAKAAGSFGHLLKPGVSLSAEQIPLFIRMNRDELALIPQFFTEKCPIAQTGLRVELADKHLIQIFPHYDVLSEYAGQDVRLFDDFVYLEGEGFHELPIELRLPEKYRYPTEVEGEELDLFLSYEINEIKKYITYLDPRLVRPQSLTLMTEGIEQAKDKGRGWYWFNLFYQTEAGQISLFALRQALNKKRQHFAFFEAGLLDLHSKRFDWIRRLGKDRFDKEKNAILLSALEFMRLNAFDSVYLTKGEELRHRKSQEYFDELTQLHTPEVPDIGGLVSHLRPYQELGVHWLWFLYSQQLSGLLCDDMGLGKTHQAMALVASVSNLFQSYAEGSQHHFLVVCPTSVIYHWQEKLHHFLPKLRVCTFYGTKRSLEEFHQQYDVLLTSYGILRNEKELLSKVSFEVAIFDEIQVAKNQFSQVYAALRGVKAKMKLGLTGTPIENHLRELKSLFDIVLPSYMPNETDYRDFFIKPIEKEHNPHRKDLLNRLIKPFTLRRKKEDVLTDLPEKIEEIAYCDLSPYQHQLYSEVLEQRRRHLVEELKNEQTSIPYLHIFALLSSLKQICDHPAVYFKKPEDYAKYTSGKWELFLELLREARESRQKVVIFSQYLGMLDIIEHYLSDQGIGFAALRGATQHRKEQLQRFNQDPECEVFVGSLQAAGLGVDLTAGSVVIHYDRWWNAARENQATDRVHRIGQVRGVQVFKLVTKSTFEEKIDAMIARKGQLMEDVVGVDDQNTLKKFTRAELLDLLELTETEEEHPTVSDID